MKIFNIIFIFIASISLQAQNATWTKLFDYSSNNPIHFDDLYFVSQNTGYMLGSINSLDLPVFILKTTDGGQTWSEIFYSEQIDFDGNGKREIYFSSTQPQIGMIVSPSYSTGYSIFRTTDGGLTWTEKFIPNIDGIKTATIKNDTVFLYCAENNNGSRKGRFYTSIDFGNTWNLKYNGNEYHGFLQLSFVNNIIGFGQNHGESYKTVDGGYTWQKTGEFQNPAGMSESPTALVFKNQQTGFSGGFYMSQFMKTTDGGQNWVPLQIENGQQPGIQGIYLYNNAVYGVSSNVFRSLDLGNTWTEIASGQKEIMHLFDEYTGIAVRNGFGEIYKMDTSSLSAENPQLETKINVYPNPSREQLCVELSEGTEIQNFKIFNLAERQVSISPPSQTGNNFVLDVSSLATGEYFLQIQTNQGKTTKKILIK